MLRNSGEMRMDTISTSLAYGVDPTRKERYSLRQARYDAIGREIAEALPQFQRGERLKLLDVGVWNGVSMRYIEQHDPQHRVEYHGIDLKLRTMYKPEAWTTLQEGDLLDGFPHLPSNHFDVVICEQVLEHLPEVDSALATLCRVVKPGGLMILGVPIFPPGLHLVRRHVVPLVDRVVPPRKVRGHQQAFSRGSFLAAIARNCDVTIQSSRGFRMISGGVLRGLENSRVWWQLNCALGQWLPGLCIEIQVLARKNPVPNSSGVAACETSQSRAA
jgi:SAM-dependent methyltransferase